MVAIDWTKLTQTEKKEFIKAMLILRGDKRQPKKKSPNNHDEEKI